MCLAILFFAVITVGIQVFLRIIELSTILFGPSLAIKRAHMKFYSIPRLISLFTTVTSQPQPLLKSHRFFIQQ
jgi:hypothetical protein